MERVSGFAFAPLSSAEASLCRGEAGKKEKESARGIMGRGRKKSLFPPFPSSHRHPRAFYFFDYYCFYRDTKREPLWRRERSRDIFHFWIPERKKVEKVYNNWYYTWASNVFTVWHKFSGEQSTNPGEISYKNKIVVGGVIFSGLNFGKWVNVTQGKRTSKKRRFLKVLVNFSGPESYFKIKTERMYVSISIRYFKKELIKSRTSI